MKKKGYVRRNITITPEQDKYTRRRMLKLSEFVQKKLDEMIKRNK